MHYREPETLGEWQEVVESADFLLLLDTCHKSMFGLFDISRQYGLVDATGNIDAARCAALLTEGRRRGILSNVEQAARHESVGWPF